MGSGISRRRNHPARTRFASAQATTGEITGRVIDSAGLGVPGATVTALNDATGLTRSVVTGAEGDYTIAQLPPGTYTVTAELTGFKQASAPDITSPSACGGRCPSSSRSGAVTETGRGHGGVAAGRNHAIRHRRRRDVAGDRQPADAQSHVCRAHDHHARGAPGRELRSDEDAHRQLRDERRRRPAARRQRRRRRQQGQRRRQPDPELRLRVDPGVPGAAAPLDGRERPIGRAASSTSSSKSGTNQLRGSAVRQLPRRQHADDGLLRAAAQGRRSRRSTRPTFSARSSAARSADRSRATRCSSSARCERFRERSNNVLTQTAFNQLSAVPGAQVLSTIPTPYDDTLLTAKVDWQPSGGSQTLFARFAYQDQSSPNDQIPVPATADLNNGNTQHHAELRLRGQPYVDHRVEPAESALVPLPGLQERDPAERHRRRRSSISRAWTPARTPTRRSRRRSRSTSSATTSRCRPARTR